MKPYAYKRSAVASLRRALCLLKGRQPQIYNASVAIGRAQNRLKEFREMTRYVSLFPFFVGVLLITAASCGRAGQQVFMLQTSTDLQTWHSTGICITNTGEPAVFIRLGPIGKQWTSVPGAIGYLVFEFDANDVPIKVTDSGLGRTYTGTNTIRVAAYDDWNISDLSQPL